MWPIHYLNLTNLRILRFSCGLHLGQLQCWHSCMQSYKIMEATGVEPVTRNYVAALPTELRFHMEMGFKHQPIRSIGFLFSLLSRMHPTSSGLWSAWSDSNRQGLRRRILSAVCLAISSHADIHLKPTSYLIAISSIGSWMMLSIPIPFIMPNRLTGAPYLALLSIRRSQSLL